MRPIFPEVKYHPVARLWKATNLKRMSDMKKYLKKMNAQINKVHKYLEEDKLELAEDQLNILYGFEEDLYTGSWWNNYPSKKKGTKK